MLEVYLKLRLNPAEKFTDTVERVGIVPFRDAVYAPNQEVACA